jgi:hypothetical protein
VAIAKALAAGLAVRRLSLRDNLITDLGAVALAQALGRSGGIEELDLWGNRLGNVGMSALERVPAKCEVFLELDPPWLPQPELLQAACAKMRSILFEWISQVHSGVQMPGAAERGLDPQDVLFRTYGHVDAFTSRRPVERSELQLTGVACTLLAGGFGAHSTMEESELAPWLAFVTDGTCTLEEVEARVSEVQRVLGFSLRQPTVYTFLRRFLRRTGWTERSFSLANYLIELAAMDITFRAFRPQAVAAAATVLSRLYFSSGAGLKQSPCWKRRLLRCAHVDARTELAECAAALARLHAAEQSKQHKFVNRKYSWARLHMVAQIPSTMPCDPSYFLKYIST